ncbi:DUF2996 domain-containing protein [Gloeocapsa sp. PCC 73106]|uniref:DUF2996 domain-containing protein n=1 Tax=Gloeocapsa sp. PCC 73106 TaxID=102232 RepID=UPI0002ACA983|nr:DUF2996 domain-containing protein [Gloeocapsa sp. PCC 73106]ELR98643.1 Protein of unknown function (DUF2996) [Gloeocapsa sp. PCC 73106]
MAEETKPQAKPPAAKPPKPPALEEKPFAEFIEQNFLKELEQALKAKGIPDIKLKFTKENLPLEGNTDSCWQVKGNFLQGQRQFNLYFLEEKISGKKAFSYANNGSQPSTIESFMIDERKVTLELMILYTLQRLNGQKWLQGN